MNQAQITRRVYYESTNGLQPHAAAGNALSRALSFLAISSRKNNETLQALPQHNSL